MTGRRSGFVAAITSAVSFSTLGLFAKTLYASGFSVACALAWRFSIAAVFLWIMVYVRAQFRRRAAFQRIEAPLNARPSLSELSRPDSGAFFRVAMLGLLGFAPQAGLFFVTVRMLDPGIASLLLYLYPSFVFLIGFVLKHQKSGRAQFFALGVSLAGCIITFWKAGSYPVLGLVLGIVVALTYAAYLIVSESVLEHIDSVWATAVIMSVAAFVYACIALASGSFKVPASAVQILLVSGIAVVATVVPIVALFQAMQKIGARNTSIISTIEPVFTNVFSMVLLGEILTGQRIVGGVLILAGVIVIDRLGYSPDSTISATSSIGRSSPISKSPGTDEGKS